MSCTNDLLSLPQATLHLAQTKPRRVFWRCEITIYVEISSHGGGGGGGAQGLLVCEGDTIQLGKSGFNKPDEKCGSFPCPSGRGGGCCLGGMCVAGI